MLYYTPDKMKNSVQVVAIAFTQNGCALEYRSDELKNNMRVVTVAVAHDGFPVHSNMYPMK